MKYLHAMQCPDGHAWDVCLIRGVIYLLPERGGRLAFAKVCTLECIPVAYIISIFEYDFLLLLVTTDEMSFSYRTVVFISTPRPPLLISYFSFIFFIIEM